MKPRANALAALVATLLLLAQTPSRVAASPPQAATRQKESVVLLVSKDGTPDAQVEPIAVIDRRGALSEPDTGTAPDGSLSEFLTRRYQPGTKYHLIFGGADAGDLTIRAVISAECSPNTASVNVNPSMASALGGNVMALATDGAHAPRAQASRRAPTALERAAALRLVKRLLLGRRVSASTVERGTKTLNLTATDLDGDGREELIGSYVIKTGARIRDTLFLVAAPQGQDFRAAFNKYERVKASELMDPSQLDNLGEGGLGTELYVEQLDADGDGVGEIFTLSRSFEGTTYRAYRRERGVWRAVYENYSYRCAY